MDEIDDLTREKLREWQMRRLEIKDQMQLYPEKTLELSRVLDLMDEEHAVILAASTGAQPEVVAPRGARLEQAATFEHSLRPGAGKFDLQLQIAANNPEDLRRLLDTAVYELQGQIASKGAVAADERRCYPGGMSGSLGEYRFELGVNGEAGHGGCAREDAPELNEEYRQD